jgi:uncharacterized protein YkwD
MLVGLAAPAAADTPVAPTAGATPISANIAAAPSFAPKGHDKKEARRDAAALRLVNDQRAIKGCKPLQEASNLQSAAVGQSSDQAKRNQTGHAGANGSKINSRLSGLGYSRWAENVARNGTRQAAVNWWMGSAGHRANILNCAFTKTGLDSERNRTSGEIYWTQTFGR